MERNDIAALVKRLAAAPNSITFEAGLSNTEVRAVEERFGFVFPPDLRTLIQFALPLPRTPPADAEHRGWNGFPDWRHLESVVLEKQVKNPVEGVLGDVRESGYWLEKWGPKPNSGDEAAANAAVLLAAAPKLIPVYGPRYICETPHAEGNPIISVSQTDIVYYGSDLANYLHQEFFASSEERNAHLQQGGFADVAFWSDIIENP